MKNTKTKLLVCVSGGIIQWTASNKEDIDIVVVDMDVYKDAIDNGGEPENPVRGVFATDHVVENMYELFEDKNDPKEVEIRKELKHIKF